LRFDIWHFSIMFTSLKRIFKSGWQNFKRQANLSLAASLVLVITISLISFLFVAHKILDFAITEIKAKADISVYFQKDCEEDDILSLRGELNKLEGIGDIEYISQEQALERFIERHRDEQEIMDSLIEVGSNPFLASLNIKAMDAESYEKATDFLEGGDFDSSIEKVDFYKRKTIIDRIFEITSFVNGAGVAVSLALVFVSVLLTYNTIRLTIFSQKEEIGIARLVGASNWFIRGPFLVQGLMCGILAFVLSFVIVGSCFYFLNSRIDMFFPGLEILGFFRNDLANIVLIELACGLVLGIIPSFIAIRKYLDI
jgi:cell division transport system permease protein